jgi:transposase-like protein
MARRGRGGLSAHAGAVLHCPQAAQLAEVRTLEGAQDGGRDLRDIYAAITIAEAEQALERISVSWDAKYPAIGLSWRADWRRDGVFNYAPEVRKVIYTTNAVESLNYSLR